MKKNACIPFWAADALLTLSSTKVYEFLTPEIISRLSAFVDSYVLFDKIFLPERYSNYKEIEALNQKDCINFIPKNTLLHSDDLKDGLSFDIGTFIKTYPEIVKDDKHWALQHDPKTFSAIFKESPDMYQENLMSQIRIWAYCLLSEVAEKYQATAILPNSLQQIEILNGKKNIDYDIALSCYNDFVNNFSGKIISASKKTNDSFIDTIKSFPPLLALLLHQSKDRENLIENLKKLRDDYFEIRKIRKNFTQSIEEADSIGEKTEIIKEWEKCWDTLLKNDFKKIGFLSKEISSSNIVKLIFDPNNYINILKFITEQSFDYRKETKSFKRFQIFSKISKETSAIYFDSEILYKKFGIKGVLEKSV